MKRKTIIVLVAAVAVALTLVAFYANSGIQSPKQEEKFRIAKVVRRDLGASVQATGIVKAMVGAEVKVGARTPGKVVNLPINVGDRVEQGQVIATIEQDDLIARVRLQEAILAEVKAEHSRLAKDFERDKQLHETKSISVQRYDLTEALHEIARARVLKAQAELDVAKAQLSYATVVAPIKGTVASVNTVQGETVTTGLTAPTFIKIIDLDRLEVLAYVDENDVGNVKVGQEASFTVAAHPSTDFKGRITSIYPSATIQDNVVYYLTSVSVDNREGKLMPDMTANVSIFLDRRKGVLTVPNQTVQREGSKKYVYVLHNETSEKRYVSTGWKDSSYTEILDGLKDGETVTIGDPGRK
ncbi:efflux RND transporter periplasmic adaptor subunit [Desulfomonile tiedjei]|uniref:RND family efflux transporter, MFP subunit n=1 Tax=Desulfomonile tiedjei (strain ATCC 49306 / DSM 6799 / DCB-1) TaxID=706587 RepID=I4C0V5_DESTA|nr:efflux RND transporter periplasmic adaptor subunit [Desulfomonile tiedjei]AFM23196.1 RND family efflux transporter, MFP subunit [Desulfomonile tiedjei DSM 6799]